MEINIGSNYKECKLGQLREGDVFLYHGELYIVTDNDSDYIDEKRIDLDGSFVVVELHNGHIYDFRENCTVIVPESAKLNIKL